MSKVTAFILTMIGIVIGVNMLAPVNTIVGVSVMNVTAGYSAATVSVSVLLPLLMVVVLMVFAVKSIEE